MTVDPVGPVDPISNARKIDKPARPRPAGGADSVNVSSEAKSMAEIYAAKEIASNSPEIRADRVAEAKRKLQDPNYITDTVINEVADRLRESFGI